MTKRAGRLFRQYVQLSLAIPFSFTIYESLKQEKARNEFFTAIKHKAYALVPLLPHPGSSVVTVSDS